MTIRSAFLLGISLLSVPALARTQEEKTGDFSAVHIAAGIHATVEVGHDTSVRIDADDEIMPFVDVHVEGNELYVGFKRHTSFRGEHTVKATIQTPHLIRSAAAAVRRCARPSPAAPTPPSRRAAAATCACAEWTRRACA